MDNHCLRRLIACAKSQEERLLTNGKIRENVGYDTSDPFLNDTCSDEKLQPGSPVVLIGTAEICTYVESVAENLHKICHKKAAPEDLKKQISEKTSEGKSPGVWKNSEDRLEVSENKLLAKHHQTTNLLRNICGVLVFRFQ